MQATAGYMELVADPRHSGGVGVVVEVDQAERDTEPQQGTVHLAVAGGADERAGEGVFASDEASADVLGVVLRCGVVQSAPMSRSPAATAAKLAVCRLPGCSSQQS